MLIGGSLSITLVKEIILFDIFIVYMAIDHLYDL